MVLSRGSTGLVAVVASVASALLTGVLSAGCSSPGGTPSAPAPSPSAAALSAAAPSAAAPPEGAAGPNGTDLAWLQLVIAMNQRLLPVLDLAADRAGDPEVALLAESARTARTDELAQLRQLAARVTMPTENPHEGHNMPGMTTPDQLTVLGRSRGTEFDRLFADALWAHADQAARLCTGEQKAGADQSFRDMAATMAATAERERAVLDPMRKP